MAEHLNTNTHCVKCHSALTIEEMHYYEREDGAATCNACEGEWMAEMADWKRGEREAMPARQGTGHAHRAD